MSIKNDFIVIPINNDNYDFNEMANELESRILASLGAKVTITINEDE